MKHLRYDYFAAAMGHKIDKHATQVVKDLGITYQHATPQSIAEQWWFWNCENIPDQLPEYITELIADPDDVIGYGLSKEDAEKIKNYGTIHP